MGSNKGALLSLLYWPYDPASAMISGAVWTYMACYSSMPIKPNPHAMQVALPHGFFESIMS
jgi:hypothetical protein